MRVFISEYVCGGGWPDGAPPASLAREGRSMLAAVLDDFARIAGCRPVTTWDGRLGSSAAIRTSDGGRAEIVDVSDPAEELSHFERLAAQADATFVIAPEFDGILADRCRMVERSGGRLLGPSSQAIALCADKLALHVHFEEHGIATIPTWEGIECGARNAERGTDEDGEIRFREFSPRRDSTELAEVRVPASPRRPQFVVKPRDGAGSLDVTLVYNSNELTQAVKRISTGSPPRTAILQPFIAGEALSVSAIVSAEGERIELFPVGRQLLSEDGRFQYLGGTIPAADVAPNRVRELVRRAIRSVPGLRGYVGFDLIRPADDPDQIVVCEINPRLTTSYLGYRALTDENLAERILNPVAARPPIKWHNRSIQFTTDGDTQPSRSLSPVV